MSDPTTTIIPLPVAAPPMLEQAIGYSGEARLVAFFFSGDNAYYADGQFTPAGEWDAYDLFTNHPLVAVHLRDYDLGSSEGPPAHYLLLDRQSRTLSVAPMADTLQLLREQWTLQELAEPEVTEEELQDLRDDLLAWLSQVPSARVMMERWQEHQRLVEALAAWLAEAWEGTL